METNLTNKMKKSNVMACIKTHFNKEDELQTLEYKLIQTEDNYYKITFTTKYNRERQIEDTILFESKHKALATKMFAHIATNDIEEYYKNYLI